MVGIIYLTMVYPFMQEKPRKGFKKKRLEIKKTILNVIKDSLKQYYFKIFIFLFTISILFFFNSWDILEVKKQELFPNFDTTRGYLFHERVDFRGDKVVLEPRRPHMASTYIKVEASNLQEIILFAVYKYNFIPNQANVVYQTISPQFKKNIIDSVVQEVSKNISAKYAADILINKRLIVSSEISQSLATQLLFHNIYLDTFSIISCWYPYRLTSIVKLNQTVEEQNAEKVQRNFKRIKEEAKIIMERNKQGLYDRKK